ncbi:hypothetical protein N431DRAFT_474770 [Stipitochalara longipes BDJ]|nr:hypothetical protein N431DRAFT_474770 [Stipitochalara longipes BDJ]
MAANSDSMDFIATSQTPSSTFKLFPALAAELRIMIWKAYLENEIRVVRIHDYKWSHPRIANPPYYRLRVRRAVTKTLGILHANKESRAGGLKVYKAVFGTRLRHPVWFNFSNDFLVFDGRYPDWMFELFMNIGCERNEEKSEAERQMLHVELRNLV